MLPHIAPRMLGCSRTDRGFWLRFQPAQLGNVERVWDYTAGAWVNQPRDWVRFAETSDRAWQAPLQRRAHTVLHALVQRAPPCRPVSQTLPLLPCCGFANLAGPHANCPANTKLQVADCQAYMRFINANQDVLLFGTDQVSLNYLESLSRSLDGSGARGSTVCPHWPAQGSTGSCLSGAPASIS